MSKKKSKLKDQRVNLRISLQEKDQLDKLVELTNAAGASEVIRRALLVFEKLYKSKQDDGSIVLRDSNGNETTLWLL